MGYHPETLAFSFPPYPRGGAALTMKDGSRPKKPFSLARALYALKPWIGFDIWHIDPEKRSDDQRTDDSCGWFDRRPGPYAAAVKEMLSDTTAMHDIKLALKRSVEVPMPYYAGISDPDRIGRGYPRLSQADALALVLMVVTTLEMRRWWDSYLAAPFWKKPFIRRQRLHDLAFSLALNPIDNLSSIDEPESFVRLVAGAMHRQIRPWWRHPRWHVHHWSIKFDLKHNLRRMFQRCGGCGKRLGFGHCPVVVGEQTYHSSGCADSPFRMGAAPSPTPHQSGGGR